MSKYVVLLRGINVGGKNKLPMAKLKTCLEEMGYTNVITYIASGNVVLESRKSATTISSEIEKILPQRFKLDSELIKVLVLSDNQLRNIIKNKPIGFGDTPDLYYSDVIFLIGVSEANVMTVFDPKEGVDIIWQGKRVIYSQRLGELRTKSRLSKIITTPIYKSMTIRSWNTVTKLLDLLDN